MNKRGFTLLEVMVATVVMAVAVVGLLSALSTSLRNAARLTDYDRAVLLGRQKMDELLIADKLPKLAPFEGTWDPEVTGGAPIVWRARLSPFEMPPNASPGALILERIQLEILWGNPDRRRSFTLEGYRRATLTPEDAAAGAVP
ncbi:MAG TPA: prepilin-type N-terminal cleavage/methylation domain-containing protein [Bryobacteraceae bacterium]|nr:prepilin-type N-terminal cleavage/methylation domain-containing protein [Bryobacteraceae bacterium]